MGQAVATASLRFDVGRGIGMGHKRRMDALAHALGELKVKCESGPVGPAIADIVVVDSYRRRADDRSIFVGQVVAALDDLKRDLAVEVLVDPNPLAFATDHPSARKVLTGLAYALIDETLDRLSPRPIRTEVETILMTSGAADDTGWGAQVAAALARSIPGASIRLVVGPWSDRSVPSGVEVVSTENGLGPVLAEADLVVTAGGLTMLEALRLGRPTVAVALRENQRQYVEGAAKIGAAVLADPESAAVVAADLADDFERRAALSQVAAKLIDGAGARRLAKELVGLLSN